MSNFHRFVFELTAILPKHLQHFPQPTPGFAQAIPDAFRQSGDGYDREDEDGC